MGLVARKPVFWDLPTTKAQTPAHTRSLVIAFVIRLMESIISRLATSKISIFWLVSVAVQAGLNITLSETPKTAFVATRPIYELLISSQSSGAISLSI